MSIAIIQQGDIGILQKNYIKTAEVRKVKRTENGIVIDPVTIRENAMIGEAISQTLIR